MGFSFDGNVDPLAQITAPPVDETPEQRWIREREEDDAKKISDQIDEALRLEREEGKAKRKNRLKVLLLGQSESGTSTLQFPTLSPSMRPCHFLKFFPPPYGVQISNFPYPNLWHSWIVPTGTSSLELRSSSLRRLHLPLCFHFFHCCIETLVRLRPVAMVLCCI